MLLFATALIVGCAPSLIASPADEAYGAYLNGDHAGRQESIERLVAMGDDGLPYLLRIVRSDQTNRTERRINKVRPPLLDAIVRINTDSAADALMQGAQRARIKIGDPDYAPAWIHALAAMGRKGLDRLILLSRETELSFAVKPDYLWQVLVPHQQSTSLARHAREAIAEVNDLPAAPALAELLDDRFYTLASLTALRRMKAAGYEDKALRIWKVNTVTREQQAAALAYLLAVDCGKYIGLLEEKLKELDAEVARLLMNLADLRARHVRDFVADDAIIYVVFRMGGDPVANATLRRYIESRLWDKAGPSYREMTVAYAVMALALSRAPDVRPVLVGLLTDATPIDPGWTGTPLSRYRLDGTGRGTGMPLFVVAAKALEELGDPSVVSEIEKLAAINDPLFGRCFQEVIAALRSTEKANQAPEDAARKLADPQR